MMLLSDELIACLSVCSSVEMICIWSSWCHCHPIIACLHQNPDRFNLSSASLPRLSWKRGR